MIIHESNLVITTRGEHPSWYSGDAKYVVWNGRKELVAASYLPTLIMYLDRKYRPRAFKKNYFLMED